MQASKNKSNAKSLKRFICKEVSNKFTNGSSYTASQHKFGVFYIQTSNKQRASRYAVT